MYMTNFSSNFFSDIAWTINANFHVAPRRGGKKTSVYGPGHTTKMVAIPIYDKNLQKSSPTKLIFLCS